MSSEERFSMFGFAFMLVGAFLFYFDIGCEIKFDCVAGKDIKVNGKVYRCIPVGVDSE